jgi:hypothetical protein
MFTEIEDKDDPEVQKMVEFISPCRCSGSSKYVHAVCLENWCFMPNEPPKTRCTVCNTSFQRKPYSWAQKIILATWMCKMALFHVPRMVLRMLFFEDMIYSKMSFALLTMIMFKFFMPFSAKPVPHDEWLVFFICIEAAFYLHTMWSVFLETFCTTRMFFGQTPASPEVLAKVAKYYGQGTDEEKVVFQSLLHSEILNCELWTPNLWTLPDFSFSLRHPMELSMLTGGPLPAFSVFSAWKHLQFMFTKMFFGHQFSLGFCIWRCLRMCVIVYFINFFTQINLPLVICKAHVKTLWSHSQRLLQRHKSESFQATFCSVSK